MNILFINGSPNKNGNTKALAEKMLKGKAYETLNLTDYRIGSYGQNFQDDQLDEVIDKMKAADVIVVGSPLYWHNICGSVRNVLDRFYGKAGEYTMKRFAGLYGMEYGGMATNGDEASKLFKA